MRNLVPPPPSLQCDHCHGELRLKQFVPGERSDEFDVEIFVCPGCGLELISRVVHDPYAPRHVASAKVSA